MTTLVLQGLAALPAGAHCLRMLLARLARAIDALVSAQAARAVPEWQVRLVHREINRYQGLIRAGEMRQRKQGKKAPPAKDSLCLGMSESAICNFSR
jgi:hypothetical protein